MATTSHSGTGNDARGVTTLAGASTWSSPGLGAADRAVSTITSRYAPEGAAASSSVSLRSLGFADRLLMPRLMSSRFAERAAAGPSRMGVGAPTAVYPFPWFADELAKIETARMMLGNRPTLMSRAAVQPTQMMAPQSVPTEALAWVDLSGYQSAPQVQTIAPRAFPQAMPNVMPSAMPPVAATPQAQLAALTQARAAFAQQAQAQSVSSPGLSVALPSAAPQAGFALRSEWDPAPLATAILAASANGGTVFAPFASPLMVHSAIGMALAAGASVEGAGAGAEARMFAPAQRGANQPRTMLAVSDSMLRADQAPQQKAAPSVQARAVQAQLMTAQRAHEALAATQPEMAAVAPAAQPEYAQMFAPAGLVAGLAPSMVDLASALMPPAAMPAVTVASALTSAAAPGGFALPMRDAMASRAPSLAPVFQAAYAMPAFVPAPSPTSALAAAAPSMTMTALPAAQPTRSDSFVQSLTRILARQDAATFTSPAAGQPATEPSRAPAFADIAARFVPAFVSVGPDGAPAQMRSAPATRPVATPSLGAQLAPLASLLSMSPATMAAAAPGFAPSAELTQPSMLGTAPLAPVFTPAIEQLRSQIFAPIAQPESFMPAFTAPTFSAPVFAAPTFAAAAPAAALTAPSPESRLGRMSWTADLATSVSATLPVSAAQAPFAAMALPMVAPSFARSVGHTDWVNAQMARRSPQPAELRSMEMRLATAAPAQTLVTALDAPAPTAAAAAMRPASPAALAARDATSVLAGGQPISSPLMMAAATMMTSATMPQVMFDAGLGALPMPVLSMAALSAGAPLPSPAAAFAPAAPSFSPIVTGFSPSLAASPVPAASSGGFEPAWAMSELVASLAGVSALRDTLPSGVLEHSVWAEPTAPAQARAQAAATSLAARAPSRVPLSVAEDVAPVQAQQAQTRARAEAVQAAQRTEAVQVQVQARQAHAHAMALAHADVALEVERAHVQERRAQDIVAGMPAARAADTVPPTAPWTLPLAAAGLESNRPGAMAARFEAMANRTVARSADLALDIVDPALLAEGRALGLSPVESVAALRLAAGGPAALRGPDFSMTFLNVAPDGAESSHPAWRGASRSTTVTLAERAAQVPMGVPASFLPGLAPMAQVPQAAVFAAQAAGGGLDFQYLAGGPDRVDHGDGEMPALAPRQIPAMTLLRGSTTWPRSVEAARGQSQSATSNLTSSDGPASTWLQFTATLAGQVSGAAELMAQLSSSGMAPERAAMMAMTLAQSAPGRVPVMTTDMDGDGQADEAGRAQFDLVTGEPVRAGATTQGRAVAQLEQARAQMAVFGLPSAVDSTRATASLRGHGGARRAPASTYQTLLSAPHHETLQLSTGAIGHSAPAPSRPTLADVAPSMPEPIRNAPAAPVQAGMSREEVVRVVSSAVGGGLPSWLADAAAKQAASSPVDQFTALDLAFVQTAAPRAIPLAAKGTHEPSPPPGRGHPSGAANKKKGGGEDLEILARQIYDEILRMMDLQRERKGES